MRNFDEDKIDCHNHVFDPARFPYRSDAAYRPSGQEIGTAAQFANVLDASGVQHALFEMLVPDALARRKIWWETPKRLFRFSADNSLVIT